jgi:two-component system, NarL family, sensor kinase
VTSPAAPLLQEPPAPARGRPGGRWLPAVTAGTLLAGLALEALATDPGRISNPFLPVIVGSAVLYGWLGHLVSRRHPAHPVARVLAATGLVAGLTVLAGGHANAALFGPLPDLGAAGTLWFSRWTWVPLLGLQAVALPLAFPDGSLPSPRWRAAARAALAGPVLLAAVSATLPFSWSVWELVPVENPLAVDPAAMALPERIAAVWSVLGSAVAAAALVVRQRRGDRRVGPVLVPAVLMPPALAVSLLGPTGLPEMVVGVALAGTVTWTMLRHRVLDVDVLVNRTLVYGLLAASLVGAYVAVVALTAQAVGSTTSWLPGAVAAAVVAVVLGPLLQHLRAGVDRFLHGHRAEPAEVVARLAGTGAAGTVEDVLDRAAAALQATLRVPWVRVEVGGRTAAVGEPRTAGRRLALRHGEEDVGVLEVGARYDGERVTAADERVLAAVAAQLAATAHALLLAQRLAAARERLVAAREDERRRIRRDLHDGLGPSLAGISAGLEGAEEIARTDPAAAIGLLPGLREQTREAVADVRRLVDGLRPPALDSLGLVGVVRQELAHLAGAGGVDVRLRAPDRLPELGAATEVAALRIVLEAVHNVRRHARAASCRVDLDVAGTDLVLTVTDDGVGLGMAPPTGVGLGSMRERAEEVGGDLQVESRPGAGTTVCARLPIRTAAR